MTQKIKRVRFIGHPGDYLAPFYSAAQTTPERGRQLFLVRDWPEGQA
jgi:hypothetical protein